MVQENKRIKTDCVSSNSSNSFNSFSSFHRYPFLRLLIPLMGGIFLGDWLFSREIYISRSFWIGILCFLFLLFAASYFHKRFSFRWLFGLLVSGWFLVAGTGIANLRLQETLFDFLQSEAVYRVTLTDKPEVRERNLLCRVCTKEDKHLLLYLAKDSVGQLLKSGDELLVFARVAPPVNNGNPDEFDYARYLLHKGVSGTGFVDKGSWKLIASHSDKSLRGIALSYREKVLAMYRNMGFDGEEFAVLSALTVGYKDELGEEIRETYSVSGASHVLALSGLHIGFLYALLVFCLRILPGRHKGILFLRALFIVAALWAFAFFTGLSPSVVRSVIMFSLLALSGAIQRKGIPLNTLSVAALAMLIFNPAWLFDVGFQLSFAAVTAIVLIYPWLYRQVSFSNMLLKGAWGLLCVSLAAQVGTAPLVMMYFSAFPVYFLLTNFLVIPLVSLIMYMAVFMLLTSPFPVIQGLVAGGVKSLIEVLNGSVRWVEHLPSASIGGIWMDSLEVILFYLSVLLLMFCISSCRGKRMLALGVCLLLTVSYHLVRVIDDRPEQSVVFYNVHGCAAVHCIAADGRSWLAYADSVPDEKRIYRAVSKSWWHQRLKVPVPVLADYSSDDFSARNHLFTFAGCRVCLVNDDRWKNKMTAQPLIIDYLYLCKGYSGQLEELTHLFTTRHVVLDSSLPGYKKQRYSAECRRLGIHLISLSDEGSARFLL